MRNVIYKDDSGKLFRVLLPEEAPEEFAQYGIPVGPPDLSDLGLPEELERRLNNELYHRGIFTKNDARKRKIDVLGALQSALAVDVEKVISAYG